MGEYDVVEARQMHVYTHPVMIVVFAVLTWLVIVQIRHERRLNHQRKQAAHDTKGDR
jgi:hypothetical protein